MMLAALAGQLANKNFLVRPFTENSTVFANHDFFDVSISRISRKNVTKSPFGAANYHPFSRQFRRESVCYAAGATPLSQTKISRTRAATAGRIISVHFMTSPRTFLASLGFVLIALASPPSAKQATYFELYDHTARTLKSVNSRLRVGGPSTAAAHWIPEFLRHVNQHHVPIDFVSTHGYADASVEDMFGSHEIPMHDRVCRAVKKVHDEIKASAAPSLPLMWTEWNVPSYGKLNARDNWYVGPALSRDITQCDGIVDMLSFWTFDDVFEESGVRKEPFDGGFGLIASGRIRKPSFYDFALLHRLGDERLANPADNVLVTRRHDGNLVIAAWNLVDMDKLSQGAPVELSLNFKGVSPNASVSIQRVDETHGNPLPAYKAMGSPLSPILAQAADLNKASSLPQPEQLSLRDGKLALQLPVNCLAVIEIHP